MQLNNLHMWSGVEYFLYVSCSKVHQMSAPAAYLSQGSMDFIMQILRMKPNELGHHFEAFSINSAGIVDYTAKARQISNRNATKNHIQEALHGQLLALTGKETLCLEYMCWEELITMPYGIVVEGWPFDLLQSPSNIKTMELLRKLLQAVMTGTCCLHKLIDHELAERHAGMTRETRALLARLIQAPASKAAVAGTTATMEVTTAAAEAAPRQFAPFAEEGYPADRSMPPPPFDEDSEDNEDHKLQTQPHDEEDKSKTMPFDEENESETPNTPLAASATTPPAVFATASSIAASTGPPSIAAATSAIAPSVVATGSASMTLPAGSATAYSVAASVSAPSVAAAASASTPSGSVSAPSIVAAGSASAPLSRLGRRQQRTTQVTSDDGSERAESDKQCSDLYWRYSTVQMKWTI
ncbi:hypothetical protein EWM64_g5976 [Hericium alpestre]|uniref:Uncharacterized protein n=1 Tax=Hericium alpestre TaxID=135208 RepID=A0A4Y9ZX05_9AGAM|nr:hypothetical protein EWM64_g5976 [Hericium alpestre]